MPRYEVESELGCSLVDAVSAADAERFMRKEYGEAHGPYRAEEVPQDQTTAGFGMEAFVHETDKHWRREINRKPAAPSS